MFNVPSIKIGRFFGIPIELNLSWFVILVLVAAALGLSYFPSTAAYRALHPGISLAAGLITALLFFGSVLLHELAHSLVARSLGIPVERVTLFLFGGVSSIEDEPATPGAEFAMAVAGPGTSMALAAFFYLAYAAIYIGGGPGVVAVPLNYLATINLFVAVFNLLPGFPLDGGRILRSLLWKLTGDLLKATRWAARAGQTIGALFIVMAIVGILFGTAPVDFLWFGLIGWFLMSLASSSYRQMLIRSTLVGESVGSIASRPAVVVPGRVTVEQLVVEHILGGRHSKFPVVDEGRVLGVMSLNHAKAIPREQWERVTAADLAEGDLAWLSVPDTMTVDAALHRFEPDRVGMLLVVKDGLLDGVVTRADIVHELRRAAAAARGV
jgi:Zn-dependent protease/predicted transcriptional regulator